MLNKIQFGKSNFTLNRLHGVRACADHQYTPSKTLPLWNIYFHSLGVNDASVVIQG